MKLRDIQAFIPGWNIVYMIKEHSRFENQVAEQKRTLEYLKQQGELDVTLAKTYASEREKAKAAGDTALAAQYDAKIGEIIQSHIDKIR